ncbi:sugar phosphate isomerase/epimerase [Pedobacter polaris]|uniref:Sugar phosphate isomerase/epimerase n=1 Tax=Pedobacter polaris TaxID=2571273 RepID=A0A4U1CHK2_9SPHI|nr:sugar phosphate isomerase/epimerase [Pedobacter polaris]TKC04737.1 sugar phosphate isomerase/epimerase [Pedobacter polaris]
MNSRRTFIKQTGLLAAAVTVTPSFACTLIAKHAIGLQLYSLRDIIKNDIKGIISKVAAIGYKEVETYGYSAKDGFWGLDAKAFDSLLKEYGMKAPSGHYDLEDFMSGKSSDGLKSYIEAANVIGSEYITVPYLGGSIRKTADDFKRLSDKLNEGAKICNAAGLKFAYHNHDFEFTKFGNTTGYEIMLNNTDKKLVDFELDLYWAVRSAADPLTLFNAHPGRFKMFHVKDIDKTNKAVNTEIGQGMVDFKSIFKGAKQAGVKHYFVEHEFNYKPDELGSVKTSFEYVNNQLL